MNSTLARRSRQALSALSVAALGFAGACAAGGYAGGYYVEPVATVYGPYWYPNTYGTYTYVEYPWWGDPPPPPKNDPMRKDSPTHRAIGDQVKTSFSSRGYRQAESGDIDVTVYSSSQSQLDISGYTHIYDFKNLPKLKDQTKFKKGTVIVDVLQPKTHVLLWRGSTVIPVSNDVGKYEKDLRGAVDRIMEKYPKAGEKHEAAKEKAMEKVKEK